MLTCCPLYCECRDRVGGAPLRVILPNCKQCSGNSGCLFLTRKVNVLAKHSLKRQNNSLLVFGVKIKCFYLHYKKVYLTKILTFQYELEILHDHVVPVPLAIRRRNQQQQQRRPSSEDFLEAMESKRNGIIRSNDQVSAKHQQRVKANSNFF